MAKDTEDQSPKFERTVPPTDDNIEIVDPGPTKQGLEDERRENVGASAHDVPEGRTISAEDYNAFQAWRNSNAASVQVEPVKLSDMVESPKTTPKPLEDYEDWTMQFVPNANMIGGMWHAHHKDNVGVIIVGNEDDLRKHLDSYDKDGKLYTETNS